MPIGTFDATARGGRSLLNLSPFATTAAIVAEVEDTRGWKDGEVRGRPIGETRKGEKQDDADDLRWEVEPESTFQIANCDRSIAFEIDWQTPSERANTLHKLDTMVGVLTEFRDAVADEQRLYAERIEKHTPKP
jgi:hypothetical protein